MIVRCPGERDLESMKLSPTLAWLLRGGEDQPWEPSNGIPEGPLDDENGAPEVPASPWWLDTSSIAQRRRVNCRWTVEKTGIKNGLIDLTAAGPANLRAGRSGFQPRQNRDGGSI